MPKSEIPACAIENFSPSIVKKLLVLLLLSSPSEQLEKIKKNRTRGKAVRSIERF
jgi:hypothetical protein